MAEEQETLEWTAQEPHRGPKSKEWYTTVGIAAGIIAIIAILMESYLFVLLVVLVLVALHLSVSTKPQKVHARLTYRGIEVGNTLYPYSALDSFWVREREDGDTLILKSQKTFMPLVMVPLSEEVDPVELRDFLLDHIDEEVHEEGPIDYITEWLGL